LPPEFYRGQAYVHLSLTMEDRATGWLTPALHCAFREVLAHTMFRFGLCCPIYCCMPDHMHLLWVGIADDSDQRRAMRYFRRQMAPALDTFNVRFQSQGYDHVLRNEERTESAFEAVAEYIARNPERKQLVAQDGWRSYPYTGSLVPGYPELNPGESAYWQRFWKVYSHLRHRGLRV
ncbi:MAG TPA: hypothetical protein VHB77_15545, partial [Planctomycetaceae bacterium]|nr:hypothetical protein [Planctomycetaceae bacterium]